ncbi:MAG: 5-(carboxyamino)imidazole ribonucleotide synthase [Gemmatimonadaceae bacterium]|nr:5-(carboxyamino)imidazole ribonucleotide synthase [Gloeobacterales cyanobacterium ES-bin-141]
MVLKTVNSSTRSPATAMQGLPTVGIIGGGQLGRMMAMAAHTLGLGVVILDPTPGSPAAQVVHRSIVAPFNSLQDLRRLAGATDLLTVENEWVESQLLFQLEAEGVRVHPGAQTLALIQDKYCQREHLKAAGVPVPRFQAVASCPEAEACAREWGFPVVLKARLQGYDGRGVKIVYSVTELRQGWLELGNHPLLIEAYVPFEREVAVMVARSTTGESCIYPVVETHQHNQVCHSVTAPAELSSTMRDQCAALALRSVECFDGVGIYGVEIFLGANGEAIVNELAPRPHNSGHYTIEACFTNQFEQHLRAILGLPLGRPDLQVPAAVMVNILASADQEALNPSLDAVLAIEGVKLHWYGKRSARTGRKLGHLTAVAAERTTALERALRARAALDV